MRIRGVVTVVGSLMIAVSLIETMAQTVKCSLQRQNIENRFIIIFDEVFEKYHYLPVNNHVQN